MPAGMGSPIGGFRLPLPGDGLVVVACRGLFAAWLVLTTLMSVGIPVATADEIDDDARRIAKQLRCPICESVSVADSPAELAVQMRGVIRKKLEAGESERQILDYFVAAYGDSVLLEPPRRGLGWAVWFGPILALAGGALVLWLVLRSWVRPVSRRHAGPPTSDRRATDRGRETDTSPAEAEPHKVRARQELDAVRRGLNG
jgi:cytochrome c-type biogenesis protein CcmH